MAVTGRVTVMWQRMHGTPDVASCREVGRALQKYLDGDIDDRAARRIARHLEICRRCGMEARTYTEIKVALRRRANRAPVDSADALNRLRSFGEQLLESDAEGEPRAGD